LLYCLILAFSAAIANGTESQFPTTRPDEIAPNDSTYVHATNQPGVKILKSCAGLLARLALWWFKA